MMGSSPVGSKGARGATGSWEEWEARTCLQKISSEQKQSKTLLSLICIHLKLVLLKIMVVFKSVDWTITTTLNLGDLEWDRLSEALEQKTADGGAQW